MTGEELVLGAVVFVLAAVYDAVFAAYVRAAATGRAARAACCSVATYLVGAVGLLAIVKASVWYVAPEGCGLWIGTLLGVTLTRDHD